MGIIKISLSVFSAIIIIFIIYYGIVTYSSETKIDELISEWTIIYYMSYDNNLEQYGQYIRNEIIEGIKGSNITITILADDRQKTGLKRYVIRSKHLSEEILQTDNSASEKTLQQYLDWVAIKHPARNYAIVFLDHGGMLDDMCLDEWPGDNTKKNWLSALSVSHILNNFHNKTDGVVKLLFFQQCGRGSIENLYNFRNSAELILSSEMNVGVPNTYYKNTFKWLSSTRDASGIELAESIMSNDRHFGNYTLIRNTALTELPDWMNKVISPVITKKISTMHKIYMLKPCFEYSSAQFYDLIAWLEEFYKMNNIPDEPLEDFKKWVHEKLIIKIIVNPTIEEDDIIRKWSGLSFWVPTSFDELSEYSNYPLYNNCELYHFWKNYYLDYQ